MTRVQAEKLYFKYHKTAEEMVRRTMLFDFKLGVPDNARRLNCPQDSLRKLMRKMGLKVKYVGKGYKK